MIQFDRNWIPIPKRVLTHLTLMPALFDQQPPPRMVSPSVLDTKDLITVDETFGAIFAPLEHLLTACVALLFLTQRIREQCCTFLIAELVASFLVRQTDATLTALRCIDQVRSYSPITTQLRVGLKLIFGLRVT